MSDPTVRPVGSPTGAAASPHRLLVSTIGDEIKIASPHAKGSPDAPRAFGVSLKDRSAILPPGRSAAAAYWWDSKTGRFVTSTYYLASAPEWVQTFNDRKPADTHAGQAWTPLALPALTLRQFPAEPGAAFYDAVYGSPFGNDQLLTFARALLQREQLGQRNATDLLSVSFSSNDSVGHTHGPDSPQVRDISVRTARNHGRRTPFDTFGSCGHNDYMARTVVGARELKTRLGTYLQQVRDGRTLVVTDRGQPVAELRPLPSDDSLPSALLKLSTRGTIALPSRVGLAAFRPIRSRGASIAGAVGEDREDRF